MFRRSLKVVLPLSVMLMVGMAAQGPYSAYLGYETAGKTCSVEGINLHYTDEGSGEPVILLHGFAMTTEITWRSTGIVNALAQNYRVIGMDMRGHGLSDKPVCDHAYGVEMSKDVIRLMDSLGIEKAHLIGNSMGALVAIKTATLFPDRVISLTACGMGWARYEADKVQVLTDLARSLEDGEGFGPLIRYLRPEDDQPGWMELSAIDTIVSRFNDPRALAAMTRAMPELEVSELELRALKVPVLSVIAKADPLLADVEEMEKVVATGKIEVIDGPDHFSLTNDPRTALAISDFLKRHPCIDEPVPFS